MSSAMRMARSKRSLSLLLATSRGVSGLGATGPDAAGVTLGDDFVSASAMSKLLQQKNQHAMRTVHTDDERAHVGGGARAGDENDVALEAFAVKNFLVEEIARTLHDTLFGEQDDVE